MFCYLFHYRSTATEKAALVYRAAEELTDRGLKANPFK
jgi:hypothetical protein